MYVQYIQGLCQSGLGATDRALVPFVLVVQPRGRPHRNHSLQQLLYCRVRIRFCGHVFIGRYLAAENFVWFHYSGLSAAVSQYSIYVPLGLGKGNSHINCPTELQDSMLTLIFEVPASIRESSTLFRNLSWNIFLKYRLSHINDVFMLYLLQH
jgi:hypothetical protein